MYIYVIPFHDILIKWPRPVVCLIPSKKSQRIACSNIWESFIRLRYKSLSQYYNTILYWDFYRGHFIYTFLRDILLLCISINGLYVNGLSQHSSHESAKTNSFIVVLVSPSEVITFTNP